jgi:hypothetical protein
MSNIVKPYQSLAWTATFVLLGSAGLLSLFPNDVYATYGFGLASTLWTIVGILWKEKSLIFLNGSLTIIYVIGIIKHLMGVF